MAANKNPIYPNSVLTGSAIVDSGAGTTPQILLTAGSDGIIVTRISVTSTDVAIKELELTLTSKLAGTGTATDMAIGQLSIPLTAGTDSASDIPSVNLLDLTSMPFLQADGSLIMASGDVLKVNAKVAVTGVLNIVAFGGDYTA